MLSDIEQAIKSKIERLGIPLKDWDIKINRGVLTGYNDAFIIDNITKQKLIRDSPKSAEIIRPILRGRDIQKYHADWQNLWLLNTHNGIKESGVSPIDVKRDYLTIYRHLETFLPKIKNRIDKGENWTNLRNCAYLLDFEQPKIIYPNMTKYLPFIYDEKGYFINDKGFIITGNNIAFLTAFLNSSIFKFCFRENFPELQGGTRELRKIFFDKIPVIQVTKQTNDIFKRKILEIQALKEKKEESIHLEKEIDHLLFDMYFLTPKERKAIGFIEIK